MRAEKWCDYDLWNHEFLSENFPAEVSAPTEQRSGPALHPIQEGTTITPSEALTQAVGEDLGDEVDACFEDDYKEPTEKQKREIFKIHRGVGHPPANDFGRALRNAGVHRHLIRWAVKEMRCPVCEARVKPAARRPGALPRCLRFNQVVGTDLMEFQGGCFEKILLNIICWGTGLQMVAEVPDKKSGTVRNAFASSWGSQLRGSLGDHW